MGTSKEKNESERGKYMVRRVSYVNLQIEANGGILLIKYYLSYQIFRQKDEVKSEAEKKIDSRKENTIQLAYLGENALLWLEEKHFEAVYMFALFTY